MQKLSNKRCDKSHYGKKGDENIATDKRALHEWNYSFYRTRKGKRCKKYRTQNECKKRPKCLLWLGVKVTTTNTQSHRSVVMHKSNNKIIRMVYSCECKWIVLSFSPEWREKKHFRQFNTHSFFARDFTGWWNGKWEKVGLWISFAYMLNVECSVECSDEFESLSQLKHFHLKWNYYNALLFMVRIFNWRKISRCVKIEAILAVNRIDFSTES